MLQFSKYQGLGNDFLILDLRRHAEGGWWQGLGLGAAGDLAEDLVRRLCDRRFGVGGDGVILALPPERGGELRMRIYNADGSEAEMCGNGIRCLARFLADSDGDAPGRSWQVETMAGMIVPDLQPDGTIRVDMGPPFLRPEQVPTTLAVGAAGLPEGELEVAGVRLSVAAAGMGNPHVVIPVDAVDAVDLEGLGAALEVHPAFPARTNVHFVQVLDRGHLRMRVWERGAGPTLACGTGACATLVVCRRLGLADARARLDLPGGPLWIEWQGEGQPVLMTGPAEAVFEGVVTPALLGTVADPGPVPAAAVAAPTPAGQPEAAAIDCATACVNGCLRPEACPSAEARARVAALLDSTSLDDLVALASAAAEGRLTRREPGDGRV